MSELYTVEDKLANIDNEDKEYVMLVDKTNSLILQNIYFSDTVRFALRYERTYGEPEMTPIFDESEIDQDTLKRNLSSMYSDETPIFIFWHISRAIKTTWSMLIKYWDTFFYSAGDEAIIYLSKDNIYVYSDMILRKINSVGRNSEESIFDCLKKLDDPKSKTKYALDCLMDGFSIDMQDYLYYLFYSISEGFRAIDNDELRNEYKEYCSRIISSNMDRIVNICKPYSEKSLQSWDKFLGDGSYEKSLIDKFYEILKKTITEKS